MRVLVTGGAGFIGSHIVDALLLEGNQVAILDDLSSGERENIPPAATFFEIDIRNAAKVNEVFSQFHPDAVCHQAAQLSVSRSVREPGFDAEVNVVGLINVCSAAAEYGAKQIVFASSGGVLYGDVNTPANEDAPSHPISPYGISKWAGEQYLQFFQRQFGLKTTALRYANVYGERQNPHGEAGVVAIFCTRLLKGEPAVINGDGLYIRDYVHVSDVVQANLRSLKSKHIGFEAINIGTGSGTDVNVLADQIHAGCQQELAQRGIQRTIPPLTHGPAREGDLRSNLLDWGKANSLLGWTPQVSFDHGIRKTVSWFAQKLLPSTPR